VHGLVAACFGAGLVLAGDTARATILYLGLPGGRANAYTTRDGSVPWRRVGWADLPDVGLHALPALGDLDDDGVRDLLVGTGDGTVRAFRNAATDEAPVWIELPPWMPAVRATGRAAPALADLDGDGDPDLLVGDASGVVGAFENDGGGAPTWRAHPGWGVALAAGDVHPALGDVDGDGRVDLVVGTATGAVVAFRNGGGREPSFERAPDWDAAISGKGASPALGDLDGDGRLDLVVSDVLAHSTAFHNAGAGWEAMPDWDPPDPGSGPGAPALAVGELPLSKPSSGGSDGGSASGRITARLDASPTKGPAPLRVTFDAGRSTVPPGASISWTFGDGTSDPPLPAGVDPAVLKLAGAAYSAAKAVRDDGHYVEAVASYLALVDELVPLTVVRGPGPVTERGTNAIDRVARWYLQKIAHDLGGIYLYHDVDRAGCERYTASLLYSWESVNQAVAGGFPGLPRDNGTTGNIDRALKELADHGCEVPSPAPMFPIAEAPAPAAASVEHEYVAAGTYDATVAITDGMALATAKVRITVASSLPDAPGGPGDNETDPVEGFGATTPGGEGERVIVVREPTESAVRAAFSDAREGYATVRFETTVPIEVRRSLPRLDGEFITVDGNGATLFAPAGAYVNLIDVRGHDVIVKNIRLRGGYDNLRASHGASDVVFSHVSSTGATDDGIAVTHDTEDVTIQYCFLAGNTRSLFLKYGSTTDVSIHHSWIMKQWARGPLVSSAVLADVRNVIVEDWTMWGVRFESASSGNVVNSLFALGPYAHHVGGKVNSALRLIQSGPVFTAGNVYEGLAQTGAEGASASPVPAPPVTTMPVAEMRDHVRRRAGCLPRDAVDQAYIEQQDGWDVTESRPFRLGPGT
jgi:hypothetical protein